MPRRVDTGDAAARPTGPLNVGSPDPNLPVQVNGGPRWPPFLLLHSSRAAPSNGSNPHNTPRELLVPQEEHADLPHRSVHPECPTHQSYRRERVSRTSRAAEPIDPPAYCDRVYATRSPSEQEHPAPARQLGTPKAHVRWPHVLSTAYARWWQRHWPSTFGDGRRGQGSCPVTTCQRSGIRWALEGGASGKWSRRLPVNPTSAEEPLDARGMPALLADSTGRAHRVGLGDHNEPLLPEDRVAVRSGAAVGSVPPAGPGLALPPIDEDLDHPRLAAGGDQCPK